VEEVNMSHIHHRNAHRYKLGNKYPLLALLVAAQLSTVASAQSGGPVDPYVGPWNFGENRCDVWKWGFDSESPAIVSGVARFYTNSCGAGTVVDAGTWGPPKQPGCGTLVGPKYTFGIESFNHKSDASRNPFSKKSLIKFPQVWSDRSNSGWVASWTS